ncbi:MAG: GIY-YIG nuclease family protein [Patescibacteria group bacterium]|jgi:putative endonuclease|nr:GIY-YIG nuclease family protein [Patescibacteria group bacterium]
MYHVYILRSNKNKKTYVGFTSKQVEVRLSQHNIGSNKWTTENGPFELIYYEAYHCDKDARAREKFLKSGVGKKLVKLIKENY